MIRKYWEMGFSVIPVNGKHPAVGVTEHTRWAEEKQPESLIDFYENLPSTGWAMVTGRVSGVIGIDIDSVSRDMHDICPPSPYRKVGARGETRFFRWSPEFADLGTKVKVKRPNTGDPETGKEEALELLCNGHYTVMPPSLHPNTGKEYYWLGSELVDSEDAPPLTLAEWERCVDFVQSFNEGSSISKVELSGVFQSPPDEKRCPHGSQDRLKALCAALIEQKKSVDESVKDLLRYDQEHHKPITYFGDASRSDFKGDPYTSALGFYSSVLKFVNRKRKRNKQEPQIPGSIEVKSVNVDDLIKPEKGIEFPKSQGLIFTVQQYVLRVSRSKQDEMALGSSLAILSALASNRFHIAGRPAITHQYIMNVARSGQGKGAGFYIANKLLGPGTLEKYNLLGLRNYSSIAAFVEMLPAQRSRLDMIDEFGSLLESFSAGSQLSKEVESLLTEFYTNRGDYWKGHYTKTNGFKGGCYAPAVTLYANIQEDTLINNAKKSMIDSGLLSRFLYFSGKPDAEFNPTYNENVDVTELARECERIFPFYKIETTQPDGSIVLDAGRIEPVREVLTYGVGAVEYRNAIDSELYKKEQELEKADDITGSIFLSRFLQIAERIAIVNAVACDRREITREDYDYGINVVQASSSRSRNYLNVIGAAKMEKKILWAKKSLKKHGFMTHSKMLRNSHLESAEFQRLVKTMLESGLINEAKDSKTGNAGYQLTH